MSGLGLAMAMTPGEALKPTLRQSLVDQELDSLMESIQELRSNTYSMVDHLAPVLRPPAPRDARKEPGIAPADVPLIHRIVAARMAVREIMDMVRDAGERSAL